MQRIFQAAACVIKEFFADTFFAEGFLVLEAVVVIIWVSDTVPTSPSFESLGTSSGEMESGGVSFTALLLSSLLLQVNYFAS